MTGIYYRELGKIARDGSGVNNEESESYFRAPAKAYEQAAKAYPSDDENHVCTWPLVSLHHLGLIFMSGRVPQLCLRHDKTLWCACEGSIKYHRADLCRRT